MVMSANLEMKASAQSNQLSPWHLMTTREVAMMQLSPSSNGLSAFKRSSLDQKIARHCGQL